MNDYVIGATAADGAVRAFAATTKETVQAALERHHCSPVATAALGRMLTAAGMMASMLKGENDLLTLQVRGDGPLKGIVATADSQLNVKGYVFHPEVELPEKYKGKLDVGQAVGAGSLSVVRDLGLKDPYCGQIALITGEIAEDLTQYFAKSEQTPSAVGLGVLIDTDASVRASGGFLIQLMPNAPQDIAVQIEQSLSSLPNITDLLDMGYTPEKLLEIIFRDQNLKITQKREMRFHCNCSKERVEKALIAIGREELQKILAEDKKAELHCHFCNTQYAFIKEELEALLEKI